jgi:hypothetical protein
MGVCGKGKQGRKGGDKGQFHDILVKMKVGFSLDKGQGWRAGQGHGQARVNSLRRKVRPQALACCDRRCQPNALHRRICGRD